MAYKEKREKALALRKQGQSYSQIKLLLGVSKSTLSNWLRDYPLPKKRIQELRDHNALRIERYRETRRRQREQRLSEVYQEQKKGLLPLKKQELLVAGLLLYWGEGSKRKLLQLSLSNSNPSVLKFFIHWCESIYDIPKSKMRVYVHLYSDMNKAKELQYWSRVLKIPLKQFGKPYIKVSTKARINHKGAFGHGTCNVTVGNARVAEKVLESIHVLEDTFMRL